MELGGLGPCLRSTGCPLAHDTTSWHALDSRALGKVLGPWGKAWLGQKKQAGLGPGGSWCRFVNTTAISFDISSRINHQLAADAETSTAL